LPPPVSASTARILVVGSANVDFTVAVSRLPEPGETVSEGTLLVNHGGKGANQAVAARRLGAEVRFIGCVGEDPPGRAIRDGLAAEGIGVEGLAPTAIAATGTALITVDAAGCNQIAVAPGANRALTIEMLQAHVEDFSWARLIICQLESPLPTVRWALAEARRRGATTILNPAPVPPAPLAPWPQVDYLTPNAGEVARLTGMTADVGEAARALRERGCGTVVVTLGERGGLVESGNERFFFDAFTVGVVDTTAAGDAFNAGLAVALAEGQPLRAGLRFASGAAALACTRRGAQASLPSRADVEHFLRAMR
jgi:ribokinase